MARLGMPSLKPEGHAGELEGCRGARRGAWEMSKGSWQMPMLRAWLQHPSEVACQPRAAPKPRGKGASKEPTGGLTVPGS